jgi:threonine synthase
MRFASKAHPEKACSFREALFTGLAPDGGLYHPVETPDLKGLIASFNQGTSFADLAAETCAALLAPEVPADRARALAQRAFTPGAPGAFTFSPILRRLDEQILLLELFHGPTCAFKDFGAQFLAAAMEDAMDMEEKRIQILVATSGDTGSAVAHAFHGRAHIDVVILYPSGRVSELQEKQLTTLGGNVHALEVAGSFDDCQRLVKEAFQDPTLAAGLNLTSANSINIGRLLPQSLYYIYGGTRRSDLRGATPTLCVPSGNFGNLTAGVYAWRWGLPVRGFLAATNANDVVPLYLENGSFDPRPSLHTLSNAMDVGNPSNFERLREVFSGNWRSMASRIEGARISDERTLSTMTDICARTGVLVDPHTAVGCAAAMDHLNRVHDRKEQVIVLSTAHPAKFAETVQRATGRVPEMPERLGRCRELPKSAVPMTTHLAELSRYLLNTFR